MGLHLGIAIVPGAKTGGVVINNYTLTAAVGTFALAGQDVTLLHDSPTATHLGISAPSANPIGQNPPSSDTAAITITALKAGGGTDTAFAEDLDVDSDDNAGAQVFYGGDWQDLPYLISAPFVDGVVADLPFRSATLGPMTIQFAANPSSTIDGESAEITIVNPP